MDKKSLGQVAYEKARLMLPGDSWYLSWDQLAKETRDAWEEIILEVLEYFDFHS